MLDVLADELSLPVEEVKRLFDEFQSKHKTQDVDLFLAYLHRAHSLDTATFRLLHGRGTREVRPVDAADGEPGVAETDWAPGFDIEGLIGSGAMGEVHAANERALGRKVAIKRLLPYRARDPELSGRFLREVQITAQLDHPNIVPVYSIETGKDGSLAVALKLVEGRTLRRYLREAARRVQADEDLSLEYTLTHRLEHFLKICDAIHYAESRQIIHRDLKPSNVMLGPFNEVYVMDWGIARSLLASEEDWVAGENIEDDGKGFSHDEVRDDGEIRTQVGAILGTPHYMSPEQSFGAKDIDARSDQYALGLILFELVTLKRANSAKTALEALQRAAKAQKRPIAYLKPNTPVPRELKAIINRATEHDPNQRYPDVLALSDDVRRYLQGDAVRAQPDTTLQSILRWFSKNREKAALLVVLALVLALGGTVSGLVRERAVKEAGEVRRAAVGALVSSVANQASLIDREFLRTAGLLRGLAAAATHSLHLKTSPKVRYYRDSAFTDRRTAPADLQPSSHYGRPVSLDHPVIAIAPDVAEGGVQSDIARLASLRPHLRDLMLKSHDERDVLMGEKEQRRRLMVDGVPLAWSFVGLESGVHLGYPGKSGYPANFDPRKRPWYTLAAYSVGPRWGNAYLDAFGLGLMLPCAMSVYGSEGELAGVAGLEMSFSDLIDTYLDPREVPDAEEAFLLDSNGYVVVRSSLKEQYRSLGPGGSNAALSLRLFPAMEVVAEILEDRSGQVQVTRGGRELFYVFQKLNSTGWYFAVQVPAAALPEI